MDLLRNRLWDHVCSWVDPDHACDVKHAERAVVDLGGLGVSSDGARETFDSVDMSEMARFHFSIIGVLGFWGFGVLGFWGFGD